MPVRTDVSFVVPARNEARWIARTLDDIAAFCPLSHEVIVVDNGSEDDTAAIARGRGATVVSATGTISSLRNLGAERAGGRVIAFIDADVSLTADWAARAPQVFRRLLDGGPALAGSWYDVPDEPGWLDRTWQAPLVSRSRRDRLRGGHILVRPDVLRTIGGFDPALETGEDWDLSQRAVAAGCEIVYDPDLRVVHWGYPHTLRAFIAREAWHGRGDFVSLRTMLRSRVALLTAAYGLLHVGLLVSLLAGRPLGALACALLLAAICVGASLARYRGAGILRIAENAGLYYFYFYGRLRSLLSMLAGRSSAAASRPGLRRGVPQEPAEATAVSAASAAAGEAGGGPPH